MSRYYDYDTLCKGMHDVVLKNGALHRCIDDIKILDLQTADVRENVKAEKKAENNGIVNWFVCSNCLHDVDIQDNFCRHCGADMRGEA